MKGIKKIRIMWDIQESVLLLDTLLSVREKNKDRKEAIIELSELLRKKAIEAGISIDSYYRNINGIILQMQRMEYFLTNGKRGWEGRANMFEKAVYMYRENPRAYQAVLKEARQMVNVNKSNKDSYFEWLATRVSSAQLSSLYDVYNDIDTFCRSRSVTKLELFEITDLKTLAVVRNTVESNKVFRRMFKKSLSKMVSAIGYYISYVKENINVVEENINVIQEKPKEIEYNVNSYEKKIIDSNVEEFKQESKQEFKQEFKQESKQSIMNAHFYTVDLAQVVDYTFTTPIRYEYFGESLNTKNWKDLYVSCCRTLFEDYPNVFQFLASDKSDKTWFCKLEEIERYNIRRPKEILNGYITETNLSATDLMKRLKFLLEQCNVDYENLQITYSKSESQQINTKEGTKQKTLLLEGKKAAFSEWMIQSGMKSTTISSYLSAMNQIQEFVIKNQISGEYLYSINSLLEIQMINKKLFNNIDFVNRNTSQNNRFGVALSKYIDYLSSTSLNEASAFIEEHAESIEKTITEVTVKRYTEILEEYFSEGLRPMVIHINKFKKLYESNYSEAVNKDNDILIKELEGVGSLIAGRIFAKKNLGETSVIKIIHKTIMDTFENGAKCIFLVCILERYRNELATEFNIYNEEALASLILSQKNIAYHRKNEYIQKNDGTPNFAENVISSLKNSYTPMDYDQLKNELWYLPIEKIKACLVTQSCLVNVDSETYFFAPNLPITEDELQTLSKAMHEEIREKQFLVGKDFPELLSRVVPAVAVNTYNFKDWGLRNVFRYLLSDEFSFSGSLVCEKGRTIRMGEAYRNYCKKFPKLSLSSLKEFSAEVDVQIYWNDVLQEMVRISSTELVRNDQVYFDVEAIDSLLETICVDEYMPIKEVGLFLHFPTAGVAWNGFVLESYLLNFSERFCLYQVSIAEGGYYGVIARKSSRFTSYKDVVVDMFVNSMQWKDKESALQLLVEHGYQSRRYLRDIEILLKEATLKREQKERG